MSLDDKSKANEMENSNVLSQYLSLFNRDCQQFKQYMAPNSLVDWFGRSIRGHTKIHDYLRSEVCSEYHHVDFEKAQSCDPIEYKPTHMKTKQPPVGDIDYVLPKNKVSGISSLKLYAESDLEDDDDDVDMTPLATFQLRTPEKTSHSVAINSSTTITPPTSTTKITPTAANSETDSDNDHDDDNKPTTAKRRKLSHPSLFSYLRRQPTALKRKIVNEAGIRSLLDTNTDDEDGELEQLQFDDVTATNVDHSIEEYTPLKYLETTGILRCQANTKHADVSETTNINSASDFNAGSWDRPVRIRISYRQNTKDQQIQFALIIYEHLNKIAAAMSSRRNLMLEFSQVTDERRTNVEEGDQEEIEEIVKCEEEPPAHDTIAETATTMFLTSNEDVTAIPLMTTPTKLSNTPPATPKRKPRLPQSLSSMKRLNAHNSTTTSPATPSPKRSAARSLRL